MLKLIEFLRKRPSDKTILYGRVVFWTLIFLLLGVFFNDYSLSLPDSLKSNEQAIKYALFILGAVPIFMWASNICLAKRKYVKLIQIVFWIVLIVVWNNIEMNANMEATQPSTTTQSASFDEITKQTKKAPLEVWFWIALIGILPLLAGITGKCITEKCLKYGEKITKIRV